MHSKAFVGILPILLLGLSVTIESSPVKTQTKEIFAKDTIQFPAVSGEAQDETPVLDEESIRLKRTPQGFGFGAYEEGRREGRREEEAYEEGRREGRREEERYEERRGGHRGGIFNRRPQFHGAREGRREEVRREGRREEERFEERRGGQRSEFNRRFKRSALAAPEPQPQFYGGREGRREEQRFEEGRREGRREERREEERFEERRGGQRGGINRRY